MLLDGNVIEMWMRSFGQKIYFCGGMSERWRLNKFVRIIQRVAIRRATGGTELRKKCVKASERTLDEGRYLGNK